ncbi:DUF433 domain-containing protein [Streptomyces phytohabitans]|uniref:DUF433 domain-containing protein n=1 Tax=Streptomyces phytohabitans TaxID=1150371 RepID=UPI00345C5BB8
MSYEPRLAAALSGATPRQLSHWRRASRSGDVVLVPEISADRPILYSFRDVVALRICVQLREEASLQSIRRALNTLREDLGEGDHLSEYGLVAHPEGIYLAAPEHVAVVEAVRGGEPVIHGTRVPASDVAALVRDGVPPGQIGDFDPGVTAEAARDAADFAEYVASYGTSEPRQAVV